MTTSSQIDLTAEDLQAKMVRAKFSLEDMNDGEDVEDAEVEEEAVNHFCVVLALCGYSDWEAVEFESLIEPVWTDRENRVAVFEMPKDVYDALCRGGLEFIG